MSVSHRRIYAVVNPRAALGEARSFWLKLRGELERTIGSFPWDWTESPLQATDLVHRALRRGRDGIISVGGDGTHNEALNGLFKGDAIVNPQATLTVVSCGSGADFARSIGISPGIAPTLEIILAGRERKVDVGHLRFVLPSGVVGNRHFLNVASFGLSARISTGVKRQPHFLGGSGRFLLATVRALLANRNEKVTLHINGRTLTNQTINTAAAANGQFFGGGMRVAPHARLDDGLLDLVVIGAVQLKDFIMWGSRLYQGKHLAHPRIQCWKARTIHATSQASVPVEADGETLGTLPASFTVLPRALRVLVPGE